MIITGLEETKCILPIITKLVVQKKYSESVKLLDKIIKKCVHETVYYIIQIMIMILLYADIETRKKANIMIHNFKFMHNFTDISEIYHFRKIGIELIVIPEEIVQILNLDNNESDLEFLQYVYFCFSKEYDDLKKYYKDIYLTGTMKVHEGIYFGLLFKENVEFFEGCICPACPNCESTEFVYYIIGMMYQYILPFYLEQAEVYYKKIININKDNGWAYFRLANLYFLNKINGKKDTYYSIATTYYKKCLELDKNNEYFLYGHLNIETLEEKEKSIKKIVGINPNFKMANKIYGVLLESIDKKYKAFEQYLNCLIIDHNDYENIYLLMDYVFDKKKKSRLDSLIKICKITDNNIILGLLKVVSYEDYLKVINKTNISPKELPDTCSICLCNYNEVNGYGSIIILPCSHNFHYHCLKQMHKEDEDTCPMCRVDFSNEFDD